MPYRPFDFASVQDEVIIRKRESESISKEVEELRDKLNEAVSEKGLASPETVRASSNFDNKMNEYIFFKNKI